MTPLQQMKENARIQKQIHIEVEKQKSRVLALETATRLKPSESVYKTQQKPKYNLLAEADKIYTWLVKDLK